MPGKGLIKMHPSSNNKSIRIALHNITVCLLPRFSPFFLLALTPQSLGQGHDVLFVSSATAKHRNSQRNLMACRVGILRGVWHRRRY